FQMLKLALLSLLLVGVFGKDDMQEQCLCKDFDPCYESAVDTVLKCSEKCKHLLTELGADFDEAKKCIEAHQPKIVKASACSRKSLGPMCTEKPGQMVKKYVPETIQIAAVREITEMAKRSGLLGKTTKLFDQAQKAATCMLKCAANTDCGKKLKCSVELPPDNEIVKKVKTCALDNGFTTPVAQEICSCLNKSGVKLLDDICPTLKITKK
ncbi:hypothetical protein PMAYCL1PPCAC_17158, partial [Pristionchus mayeri]